MRHVMVAVVTAVLAIGGSLGVVACGGPPKPPMVPDDNADAGSDTPPLAVPAPSTPPVVK